MGTAHEKHNEEALALWYSWLNEGHKITASAGTDGHRAAPEGAQLGFNVVYAEALSEAAILAAVRRGRSYLSSGPKLELTRPNRSEPVTGDVIEAEATLSLRYGGVPADASLRLIANGTVERKLSLTDSGTARAVSPRHRPLVRARAARPGRHRCSPLPNPVFTPAFVGPAVESGLTAALR